MLAETKVTEKLEASADKAPVDARVVPRAETMLMAVLVVVLMGPVTPLMVADAPVKVTDPKLAKGKTPNEDDGASAIHSAEERCADAAAFAIENSLPVVLFLRYRTNVKLEVFVTDAVMESPA